MKINLASGRKVDVRFNFKFEEQKSAKGQKVRVPYATICTVQDGTESNTTKAAINKHPVDVCIIRTYHDGHEEVITKKEKEQFRKRDGRLLAFKKQVPQLRNWGFSKDELRELFDTLFSAKKEIC